MKTYREIVFFSILLHFGMYASSNQKDLWQFEHDRNQRNATNSFIQARKEQQEKLRIKTLQRFEQEEKSKKDVTIIHHVDKTLTVLDDEDMVVVDIEESEWIKI